MVKFKRPGMVGDNLLAIVISVAIIFVSAYTVKVIIHERESVSAIQHHLFVEKQYKATEIAKINVSYHLDSLIKGYEPFIINVIFSDEPDAIYYYVYKENKVSQSGVGGKSIETKHNE